MSRVILALDGMSVPMALEIAERTSGRVWGYKANDLLIDEGKQIVQKLAMFGRVFVDPKHFDIPNTMTNSVRKYRDSGADIITVHARARYFNPPEDVRDFLAGVTILTSEDLADLKEDVQIIARDIETGNVSVFENAIQRLVIHYAGKMQNARYGYMVCSAQTVGDLKGLGIKKICPAIRPKWSLVAGDDQNPDLIATPRQAILNGADLLVIGRPILKAADILEAIDMTNDEVSDTLKEAAINAIPG